MNQAEPHTTASAFNISAQEVGPDCTPSAREAGVRGWLRHLGLRLEKSRRRSVTHEDYGTCTVLDPIGNGVQFKADSPEQTLDLVESWIEEVYQCWLDGKREEMAAVAHPCILFLPELPSPGTIVRYTPRSKAKGS